MDHGHLSMVADKFQGVFAASRLNACGKDAQFCRRERLSTPFRVGLALTAPCASQRVETLADLPRGCHALWGTSRTSQAFYHQGAPPHGAACARTLAERLIGDRTLTGLGVHQGQACAALHHIVMQEGSACAMHDGWRAGFPGRCKAVKPAAVARQATLAWRCDAPTTVVLTPDTTNEPAFLPEPATLTGSWLLADLGKWNYCAKNGNPPPLCLPLTLKIPPSLRGSCGSPWPPPPSNGF